MFSQNERYKPYQMGFSFAWVLPQVWDFGALGMPKGSKKIFFKHGHVTSQIDGDDEQKGMTSRTEYK